MVAHDHGLIAVRQDSSVGFVRRPPDVFGRFRESRLPKAIARKPRAKLVPIVNI